MTAPTQTQTPRGAAPKRGTLRWAPALWAAYAQAVAFAAAAVTAFLVTDIAAAFHASPGTRLWPLGALAIGVVVAANATRRTGTLGRARYTGSIALGALALSAVALALAPGFGFAVAAAGAFGTAAGFTIALAGRVLAAAEVGDGSGSVALSAAALLAGIAAGVGALFAVPLYGWRGVFGLVVVAAVLATWKFAEYVPDDSSVLEKCDVRFV
jgi:MFS family permease